VDSLVDIAASLTNLLVVRYSLQPADEEHTFGHGKAESLAALAQSMFISGSALFLFLTGIQHLVSPTPMNDPGVGVVVTVIALIAHWFWFPALGGSQNAKSGGTGGYASLSV
jgi:ferrous-iron efflux pump FieF